MTSEPKRPGRPKADRKADCHPYEPHYATGLCQPCYYRANRAKYAGKYRPNPVKRYAYQRRQQLQRLRITEAQLNAMMKRAAGTCPCCLRSGQHLKPWRFSRAHKVLSLICWPCRLKGFIIMGIAKNRQFGVSWLERMVRLCRRSIGPDQHDITEPYD